MKEENQEAPDQLYVVHLHPCGRIVQHQVQHPVGSCCWGGGQGEEGCSPGPWLLRDRAQEEGAGGGGRHSSGKLGRGGAQLDTV